MCCARVENSADRHHITRIGGFTGKAERPFMANFHKELLEIADSLEALASSGEVGEVRNPLEELIKAAEKVGKAWGGSWLRHHANVYYEKLEVPPPGAHFSKVGSTGDWKEFNVDDLITYIRELAGTPNLDRANDLAKKTSIEFENLKTDVLSILSTSLDKKSDNFLDELKNQAEHIKILSQTDVISGLKPSGSLISRDAKAAFDGVHTPPHFLVLSEAISLLSHFDACNNLARLARKASSHLVRKNRQEKCSIEVGTNVFIGHGRSLLWRELKDFINDRLHLPWDEYNRVPVAGITNIARLSVMLDSATIAFLIMTGEDQRADGKLRARMNVIHEAGLFQGRLGFTRAIILLEEGCEEFINVEGLGQIKFPKGNIKAAFDEVRQVLEREGILQ